MNLKQFGQMPRDHRIAFCGAAALFVFALLLAIVPPIRSAIIRLAELCLVHRPLNHAIWHGRMVKSAAIIMVCCVAAVRMMMCANGTSAPNASEHYGIGTSEIVVYIAAMLLCFVCYYYYDIAANTRHGIDLWDAIREGQLLKYYSREVHREWLPGMWDQMAYEFPVYLTLAIWDVPLYIFEKLTHTSYMNCVPMVIYSKGVLVLFFLASMRVMKAICTEMGFGEEKSRGCVFFWMTSTLVIEPLFVICQYDIFGIFFTLLGYLAYLKGSNKHFVFWFGIALCYKSFSLMVFLPLLVYREKRIPFILRNLAVSAIPLICFKLMFTGDRAGREFMAASMKGWISNTINGSLNIAPGFFPLRLFIAGWIIFLLYLYTRTEWNKKCAAPIAAMGYGLFFALCRFHPYWIILVSPFVALLTFQSENHKASVIFETSMSASITVFLFCEYFWCYNANVISYSVLKNTNLFSMDYFFQRQGKGTIMSLTYALYIT